MTALSVEALSAGYGATPVLRDINLEIADGEIVSVLGPSGCGKTTLLRVLAGFMPPTVGTLRIGEIVAAGSDIQLPPERRNITIVPQEGALFPHLDVSGNIGYGVPRKLRPDRVAELLELVGLVDAAHARPHELSGGQQQRVALARALAPRPAFVLLDEPFSALDVSLRAQLRAQVTALLRHEAASALIVTHDQQEALSMSDRVAVMRAGRMEQIDSPLEVYRRPANRWVGEFVGDAVVLNASKLDRGVRTPLGDLELDGPRTGQVLLRPEQIRITDEGTTATVQDIEFRGHEHIVTAHLLDGSHVTVRHAGPGSAPPLGSTIRLSVTGTAWGI